MNQKSFTLIEILVVIVVIGILSAFILVGINSITESANITKSKAFSESLRNSLLPNIVSEWKLDEGTGTTTYDSWGINNGTLNNGPTWVTSGCVSNNCLSFDGADDYVSFSDIIIDFNGGAVSLWANSNSNFAANYAVQGHMIGRSGYQYTNYLSYKYSSGRYQLQGETNLNDQWFVNTSSIASLNQWNNIFVSFNQSTAKTYLNGLLVDTRVITTNWTINRSGLTHSTTIFQGKIDDFLIYNAPIPTSQIQQNYFLGLNSLYKNRGLTQLEYTQRLAELKDNLTQTNN